MGAGPAAGAGSGAARFVVTAERLVVSGDLDARCTETLRRTVYDLLEAHDHVVVDLSGVENADLVALRVLATASWVATRRGGQLRLRAPRPAVRRLLRVSRLGRLVALDDAPARAVGRLAVPA